MKYSKCKRKDGKRWRRNEIELNGIKGKEMKSGMVIAGKNKLAMYDRGRQGLESHREVRIWENRGRKDR